MTKGENEAGNTIQRGLSEQPAAPTISEAVALHRLALYGLRTVDPEIAAAARTAKAFLRRVGYL